ncbi:MAG: hypothetical protein AAF694_26825 [Bacteroidota bacterium]
MKKIDPLGVEFPFLEGKNLLGQEIPLPYHKAGQIRIFTLLLSNRVQKEADTWTKYVLETFQENPEIHYFEIRLFSSLYKPFAEKMDERKKEKTDPQVHSKVVRSYEDKSKICKKLGLSQQGLCYLYLLDRKGIVRYWGKGFADAVQQRELMAEIHRIYQRS